MATSGLEKAERENVETLQRMVRRLEEQVDKDNKFYRLSLDLLHARIDYEGAAVSVGNRDYIKGWKDAMESAADHIHAHICDLEERG